MERHAVASSLYHSVFVLYVRSANQKEKFSSEIIEENGIKKVLVYYKKVHSKWLMPVKFLRFYKGMKLGLSLLKEEFGLNKIDVVHHNVHFEAGIIPLYLKRKHKTPYIISEHWTAYLPSNRWEYKGFFRKWLTKKIGNNADLQVPVSEDLKNSLQELNISIGKTKIVPNVVDINKFDIGEKPNIENEVKFIHISTLDEDQKNVSGILRTFKQFLVQYPSAKLTIVGDGDHQNVEETISSLHLESSVTLLPRQNSNSIAELLKTHHIFLLFSNYENLPCVIVESLASGTPVLASTAGGTPEHLTKELGELVSPKDEDGLLSKMLFMVTHYHNYDPEVLRDYAERNFSFKIVGKQFSDIYQSLK